MEHTALNSIATHGDFLIIGNFYQLLYPSLFPVDLTTQRPNAGRDTCSVLRS
jgi:hypothetical protein